MTKIPQQNGQQNGTEDILKMHINMETPAAQRALHTGLLQAKTQAMKKASTLARAGTPLLLAVIGVSFVHLWESVSVYAPEYVPALTLPANVHYITAGAFTAAIDAVAFYVIAANNTASLAGAKENSGRWAMRFFLLLTFVLNAAFIIRHAPSLPSSFTAAALPALDMFNVIALPAFVPAAIVAVERASHMAEATRLTLLVETTVLTELLANGQSTGKASQSVSGRSTAFNRNETAVDTTTAKITDTVEADRLLGGRKSTATLEDLLTAINDRDTINRSEAAELLDCGRTKVDELLGEAVEAGKLEKIGRGIYKVVVS
jgi:hypothetical protein